MQFIGQSDAAFSQLLQSLHTYSAEPGGFQNLRGLGLCAQWTPTEAVIIMLDPVIEAADPPQTLVRGPVLENVAFPG